MRMLIFLLLISAGIRAQEKPKGPIPVLGAGLFYVNDKEFLLYPDYWYRHHQSALSLHFGYDLFKQYFRTGIESKLLYHWGGADRYQQLHYLFGWYNQVNFTAAHPKLRIWGELGLHLGNLYIPKVNGFKSEGRDGLFYLGGGWGASWMFNDKMSAYAAVTLYPLLNFEPFYYYYGNYEVGIEFRLK